MANSQQAGVTGSGMQGAQPGYLQLMHALMTNPQAFTGGGFGQTLAANPGGMSPQAASLAGNWQPGQQSGQSPIAYGGMSPMAAALAGWQPTAPAMPAAANPIPAFAAQQQAAQAAAAAATPPPAAPVVYDTNPGGSGAE